MANPLVDAVKSLEAKKDTQGPGMGNELAEKLRMQKEAGDSLRPPVAGPERPVAIGAPRPLGPRDRPGQGPYGSQPGEKRFDVSDMQKPLGGMPKMHDGGTVTHTGPHVLKKGEKVLTPEQHGHLKAAMSLASSALSHDADEPQEPKKEVKEVHLRKGANGGFIAKHIHTHFSHPDEEHVHPTMDHVHDSLEQHWGEPNDGENASEAEQDKSPGVVALQKAVGMEK